MESGTNKSLFTLIAVVIFGIFLSLSYFLFQDQLKGVLASVLDGTSQKTEENLKYMYPPTMVAFAGSSFDNNTLLLNAPFLTAKNFNGTVTSGYDGTGLNFDGVDDYLTTNAIAETDEFTLHMDILTSFKTLPAPQQSIFGAVEWYRGILHVHIIDNQSLLFDMNGAGSVWIYNCFEDNTRYSLDMVYSAKDNYTKIYINGVLKSNVQRASGSPNFVEQTPSIGTSYIINHNRRFAGTLYDFQFLPEPLTESEIITNYNN